MKKTIHILLILLLISLVSIGCSSNNKSNEEDNDKIGIRGFITDIVIDGKQGSITVEGNLDDDTMYDKGVVKITKDTLIQKDNMSRLFDISDLEEGIMVEVIFKGAVAESYPVQGTAGIVRMITVNSQK